MLERKRQIEDTWTTKSKDHAGKKKKGCYQKRKMSKYKRGEKV